MKDPVVRRCMSVGVLGIAAALALTACSDGTDANAGEQSAPPATEAPAPSPSEEATTTPTEEATIAPTEAPGASTESSAAALEAFVAVTREETEASLESMGEAFGDMFSDISIDAVPPHTLVYTYTYAMELDREATIEGLDASSDSLAAGADLVMQGMAATGVTPEQAVTYTYLNPDGSELWTRTYNSN